MIIKLLLGFEKKVVEPNYRINAGFFVLEPSIIDFIDNDDPIWEKEPLERLAEDPNY